MKNKFLFLSDTHLNLASDIEKQNLIHNIIKEDPEAILIAGDISSGKSIYEDLLYLSSSIPQHKIYIVLGNHDYHHSSFKLVHNHIDKLCEKSNVFWLTNNKPIELSKYSALIGAEGWYDGGTGYGPKALHITLDSLFIQELQKNIFSKKITSIFRSVSYSHTENIIQKLYSVINKYEQIVLITHYPPWEKATKDLKRPLHKFWTAYDTNVNLGKELEKVMKKFPNKKLIVLCGHTHKEFCDQITDNIFCVVGDGTFGKPGQSAKIFYF